MIRCLERNVPAPDYHVEKRTDPRSGETIFVVSRSSHPGRSGRMGSSYETRPGLGQSRAAVLDEFLDDPDFHVVKKVDPRTGEVTKWTRTLKSGPPSRPSAKPVRPVARSAAQEANDRLKFLKGSR